MLWPWGEGGLGAYSLVRSFWGTFMLIIPPFLLSPSHFSLSFPSFLSSPSLLSFLPVLWIRKISLKGWVLLFIAVLWIFYELPLFNPWESSCGLPSSMVHCTLLYPVLFCLVFLQKSALCRALSYCFSETLHPLLFPGLFHSSGSFPKELFIYLRFSGLFLQVKDCTDANFVPLVLLDNFIVIPFLKVFVTKVPSPGIVMFILQPWLFA